MILKIMLYMCIVYPIHSLFQPFDRLIIPFYKKYVKTRQVIASQVLNTNNCTCCSTSKAPQVTSVTNNYYNYINIHNDTKTKLSYEELKKQLDEIIKAPVVMDDGEVDWQS